MRSWSPCALTARPVMRGCLTNGGFARSAGKGDEQVSGAQTDRLVLLVTSLAHSLIVEIEAFSDTETVAGHELLLAAAELVHRVNELEALFPDSFVDLDQGPWRINRLGGNE